MLSERLVCNDISGEDVCACAHGWNMACRPPAGHLNTQQTKKQQQNNNNNNKFKRKQTVVTFIRQHLEAEKRFQRRHRSWLMVKHLLCCILQSVIMDFDDLAERSISDYSLLTYNKMYYNIICDSTFQSDPFFIKWCTFTYQS